MAPVSYDPRQIALDAAGVLCVAGAVAVAVLHGWNDPAFVGLVGLSGAYLAGRTNALAGGGAPVPSSTSPQAGPPPPAIPGAGTNPEGT